MYLVINVHGTLRSRINSLPDCFKLSQKTMVPRARCLRDTDANINIDSIVSGTTRPSHKCPTGELYAFWVSQITNGSYHIFKIYI